MAGREVTETNAASPRSLRDGIYTWFLKTLMARGGGFRRYGETRETHSTEEEAYDGLLWVYMKPNIGRILMLPLPRSPRAISRSVPSWWG